MQAKVEENKEKFGRCACGRSPIGHCIGWHNLSEDDYRQKLAEWEEQSRKPVE